MQSASSSSETRTRLGALAVLFVVLAAAACQHAPERAGALARPDPGFHADLGAFLAHHHGGGGRIAYAAAARDSADLDRYLARLRKVSPDSDPGAFPSDAHRLAYWINAYNAWAIRFVLDHYPIRSVNDVRPPLLLRWLPQGAGFFYLQRAELGERKQNLYNLENRLVRRRFAEPRIHFALNCASLGCPELPRRPFSAAGLEAELTRETARFLADPNNYRLDLEARVVSLSSIFDWYERDFTSWVSRNQPQLASTLTSWLGAHLAEDERRALASCADCRIEFLSYDWSLNDAP